MKKIILIFSLLFFAGSIVATAVHSVKGNTEAAKQAGAVSIMAFATAGIAVAPKTNYSLGLQWTRPEETLLEHLMNKGERDAKIKFANGQLRFRDYVLYRSLLVDGFSGIQRVWDNTIARATGVTNVDRAKLDKDVHVCVSRISIQYINTGGAGTNPAAVAGYDGVVTSWPAGLQNAEISIYQDSNPLIERHPVNTCGSQADSQFGVGQADAYVLQTPFVLEGDIPFEVRIDFPDALAAANTEFIKVILSGVGTRKRGQI